MSSETVHGVCIVRAAADGTGVHFSVLTTWDAVKGTADPRAESRNTSDVLAHVRYFIEEFASGHDK